MLLDIEVTHCSRRCAASGRSLAPGETYYSTVHIERGVLIRRDYAAEAWTAPADEVAWWRSRLPDADGGKPTLAPNDVLVKVFADLAHEPAQAEFRYILGLLLMRRRLLKLEDSRRDAVGEVLLIDCPRREEQFELRVAPPDAERAAELEQRLFDLLYGSE